MWIVESDSLLSLGSIIITSLCIKSCIIIPNLPQPTYLKGSTYLVSQIIIVDKIVWRQWSTQRPADRQNDDQDGQQNVQHFQAWKHDSSQPRLRNVPPKKILEQERQHRDIRQLLILPHFFNIDQDLNSSRYWGGPKIEIWPTVDPKNESEGKSLRKSYLSFHANVAK